MIKDQGDGVKKIDIEKGNQNGNANIQRDYNHDQIHGDFKIITNTSIIVNQFNRSVDHEDSTETKRKGCVIELDGNLTDILLDPIKKDMFLKALKDLRQIDPTLTMRDIQQGSIRITLDGSEDGINRILHLIDIGELDRVGTFPITLSKELQETNKAQNKLAFSETYKDLDTHTTTKKSFFNKNDAGIRVATVVRPLSLDKKSFLVRYEGRSMPAEMFYPHHVEELKVGTRVAILEQRGIVLLVAPIDDSVSIKNFFDKSPS